MYLPQSHRKGFTYSSLTCFSRYSPHISLIALQSSLDHLSPSLLRSLLLQKRKRKERVRRAMRNLAVVSSCLIVLVALCNAQPRRHVYHNDAPGGDGTVVTFQYNFPGLVQNYWWIDDLIVALSYGHLFGCRSYCSTGEWESWTESIPAFALPRGGTQRGKEGEGVVTNVIVPPAAQKVDSVLLVETFASTFILSTIYGGVRIIGNFSLDTIPHIESSPSNGDGTSAASPTMSQPVLYIGQSVVFASVFLSPTEKGVAAAVLRSPLCHSVTIVCKRYLFITHPSFGLPNDPAFSHWRHVHLDQDIHTAFFGTPEAVPYDPFRLFLLENDKTFAQDPFDGKVQSMGIGEFLRNPSSTPSLTLVADSSVVQTVQQGKFTFFVSLHNMKSLMLSVSENNAATAPVTAEFGSHLFESTTTDEAETSAGSPPGDADGETGYSIVDTSDNVFVNVYRGNRDFQQSWGHTFASGLGGHRFSLALRYNRRQPRSGAVDFHRVAGLDGVIIANVVTNPEDDYCRFCRELSQCEQNCLFATVLSRDNGQTWQKMSAPENLCPEDDNSRSEEAVEECSLHLHGVSSSATLAINPLVSSAFAPGVIIATGNTGSYLAIESDGPRSVFISRDAGDTWDLLLDGASLYDESDYGGLLWGLPLGRPVAHLNFSIDEGQSWTYSRIIPESSQKYKFTNNIAAPAYPSARFALVLGYSDDGRTDSAFTIDLSSLKDRICQGAEKPTEATSDFEVFLPSSYFSEKVGLQCLLGQMVGYTRKKYGAKCWVATAGSTGKNPLLTPKLMSQCNCTDDDYECDVGYVRQADKCVLDDPSGASSTSACSPAGLREILTGYRRLPNDHCRGGVDIDLDPVLVACVKRDSLAVGYIALVALVFMALWFVLQVRYRTNEGFRKFIQNLTRGIFTTGHRRSAYRSIPKVELDGDDVQEADDNHDGAINAEDDDEQESRNLVPAARTNEAIVSVNDGLLPAREMQDHHPPAHEKAERLDAPALTSFSNEYLVELEITDEKPEPAPLANDIGMGASPATKAPPQQTAELDDLFGFVAAPPTSSASQQREVSTSKQALW